MRTDINEVLEELVNEELIATDPVVALKLKYACTIIDGLHRDVYDMAKRGKCVCCKGSKDTCFEADECLGFEYIGPNVID